MPSDPRDPNALLPLGGLRSTRPGDLPEPLLRRYYLQTRERDCRLFVDAQSPVAVIEDRGRRLLSRRSDPNAVRDMVRIAEHRGWRRLEARGARTFRREAWLAGRTAGLEVRGYRPTERDLQALERRLAARERLDRRADDRIKPHTAAGDRLRLAEAVIRSRAPDPQAQARLMERARARIADWIERGARFEPLRPPADRPERSQEPRERRRAR
jgi:hypothetical protein